MPYTPPHQHRVHSGLHRQRALSTVAPFPHVPVIYLAPGVTPNDLGPIPALPLPIAPQQPFTVPPSRIRLPLHPRLPYVVDPSSLQMAVNHDPNEIFNAFKLLAKERDELRDANNKLRAENNQLKAERNTLEIENKNVTENYESAKLDFRVARDKLDKMEQICAIQSAKQVVLFKMIDRLKNGQTGPPTGGDGFWLPVNGFPMAPVSEASEPSSEQSSGTMGSKDSCETKLDPHAQAFVPQSPIKSFDPNATKPNSPTKPNAPTESETSDEQATPTNEADAFINASINPIDEAVKEVIVKLPAQYFGVCPNSLSTPGRCPLIHCRLQPLCEDFNDENGRGCKNRACNFAHIYRTCTEMLDGVECSYTQVKEQSPKKKAHFSKRAHPDGQYAVPKKDWKIRVAIAGLRDAHKEMRY